MKKGKLSTILLSVILVIGIGLLLYPTVANLYNSRFQAKAINNYVKQISSMNKDDFDAIWQEVREYNCDLLQRGNRKFLSDEEMERYRYTLDVSGTGIMGYIDIPSIKVELPIYHGTDDGVLQIAAGHLEWSSLPARGESVHCVLSGHRGLPSAKLFTDLSELSVGDTFSITVLDQILNYEIDQIRIVEPEDVTELVITPGEEQCTLITCTPYGINTHRILVRAHIVSSEDQNGAIRITSDALQIEEIIIAPILAMPLLIVLLFVLFLPKKKTREMK